MKKTILASAIIATMGIGAFTVYADSTTVNEFDPSYNDVSDNGLTKGRINTDREIFTDEDAADWRADIEERDRFDTENRSNRRHHHGDMKNEYRNGLAYGCH